MANDASRELLAGLRLFLTPGIGPGTYQALLTYFKTASAALAGLPDFVSAGGRKKKFLVASEKEAVCQLKEAEKNNCEILSLADLAYPDALKSISAPPPFLFVRGNAALLRAKSVAVVGTRNASLNGKNFTHRLAADLAKAGWSVVSGMARGIDAAAHKGALSVTGGGTIGVLGTAVTDVYPPENKHIYDAILQNGCLVSEFAFDTQVVPGNFPRRNRIISGLSKAVVVVEAQVRSGSLITAREALEQGREVFAVPGFPSEARSAGTNDLLKQGASLLTSAQDVLSAFQEQLSFFEPSKPACEPVSQPEAPGDLALARQLVLDNLSGGNVSVDDLIRETRLTSSVVHIILVQLELAGRLVRNGRYVSLIL